jgi:uncharacterized repeat protein (TIGR01451 family)
VAFLGATGASFGQVCPTNIDFETGTTANWNYYMGTCCPINTPSIPSGPGTYYTLTSGSGTDPLTGFPLVAPGGGSHSLRLLGPITGALASRARYYVPIPAGPAYSLVYHYAMVFENPTTHSVANQPRMEIKAFDSVTGAMVPCDSFTYVSSSALPGFVPFGTDRYYRPWTMGTFNFRGLAGHTIAIDFAVGGCALSGHWGYAYVDMSCGLFATAISTCAAATTTLSGPPGALSYLWCDSATCSVTYSTTQNAIISTPGVRTCYAVIIAPYPGYGCVDTLYTAIVPLSSCSGTPTAGYALVINSTTCGNPDSLSVAGNSTGCGLTPQWQSSPNNITWTNITGATFYTWPCYPAYMPMYYRCAITCTTSGLTDYSVPVFVAGITTGIGFSSIVNPPDTLCNGAGFYVSTCASSPSLSITSYYGDGSSDSHPLSATGLHYASFAHHYALPGTYTIKQVLFDGALAVDSTIFPYNYVHCSTIPLKLYFDQNSDCAYNGGDTWIYTPVRIAVDSNGIAIDTVSVMRGLYYRTNGGPGTVYGFRVISSPGVMISCPSTGIFYDTILPFVYTYPVKYIGFTCGTSSYDLMEFTTMRYGPHAGYGTILVQNTSCSSPSSVIVTTHFSPEFNYYDASSVPVSYTPTSITWNLGPVTNFSPATTIDFAIHLPFGASDLLPGDTRHTGFKVIPFASDIDTTNNIVTRCDTIKYAYDPNFIEVVPGDCIPTDTTLRYTIHFENMGNDTAHNIYVLDTLPNNVDPHTLEVLAASAAMDITIGHVGGLNIVKFDFPGIKLLDSSHHGLCDGMVIFKIKTNHALPVGTIIPNRAGIYFDINPVVMTNEVKNMISVPPVVGTTFGASDVGIGASIALTNSAPGGVWSCSNGHATVSATGVVTGVSEGLDTVYYSVPNMCGSDFAIAVKEVNVTAVTLVQSITGTQGISIYPNPNNGEFVIKGATGANGNEKMTVEITNMPGQAVYKNSFIAANGLINERVKIPYPLPAGMYLLTLRSETENKVLHFMIEK